MKKLKCEKGSPRATRCFGVAFRAACAALWLLPWMAPAAMAQGQGTTGEPGKNANDNKTLNGPTATATATAGDAGDGGPGQDGNGVDVTAGIGGTGGAGGTAIAAAVNTNAVGGTATATATGGKAGDGGTGGNGDILQNGNTGGKAARPGVRRPRPRP
jgi:hypothetical protein